MDKKKVAVVLFVVAIVLSITSGIMLMSAGDFNFKLPTVTNTNTETTINGPVGGQVGFKIVPPGGA